jgi:ABC-type sugar transport system permease subunit
LAEFWSALRITIALTGLAVLLVVAFAILVALLLNEPFPGRGLVRTLILVPWAIPPVVNGLMWQWIYDSNAGALNGQYQHAHARENIKASWYLEWDRFTQQQIQNVLLKKIAPRDALDASAKKARDLKKQWS